MRKRNYSTLLWQALVLAITSSPVAAWDGYVVETGTAIEVISYDHQGNGEGEVEYYDYEAGEYKEGYLDMFPGGSGELLDYETGEVLQVDMYN